MTTRLRDIQNCFEGVIPSVVASHDTDGVPNISYLSQVWRVDDDHVALSNQFFSKTVANVRQTGHATVMVVDGRTGAQNQLYLRWSESLSTGEIFERMAAQLRAISSQHGMDEVMSLRSAEVYRVLDIRPVPSLAAADDLPPATYLEGERLAGAARLAASIAAEDDAEAMLDRTLDGLVETLGFTNVMVLVPGTEDITLTTIASRGYERGGAGSEVAFGAGAIGIAAETRRPVRLSEMSRGRRFAEAVRSQTALSTERSIPLPGLPAPNSQLAAPMIAQGRMCGVIFAEDSEAFRFTREDEDALLLIGTQLAAGLRLAELQASSPSATPPLIAPALGERRVRVRYFAYDDSLFIDDEYLIKGVPGRLLLHFLQAYLAEGRSQFTNREIRLEGSLRLPGLKDNLETRLILLRRRLEERGAPVRLLRLGRGRFALEVSGTPVLEMIEDARG